VLQDDLKLRAKRLLDGDRRVEDLDRIFLGLRDRCFDREIFSEISNFVAHRGERDRGLVTTTARDVFTSIDVWSLGLCDKKPAREDILRAAKANFRLASDEQLLNGCGLRRRAVSKILTKALDKFKHGEHLSETEVGVLLYLGNRFIWKPAFTDGELFSAFCYVLLRNKIINDEAASNLQSAASFLSLYAIAVMHGSRIKLDETLKNIDGGELLAGFFNRERHLEVKVQIRFKGTPKPTFAPICMFFTRLSPESHCEPALLSLGDEFLQHVWSYPIELRSEGKLGMIEKPVSALG
jgi:hypothetical protein